MARKVIHIVEKVEEMLDVVKQHGRSRGLCVDIM
jgi:hypothetical protein